MIKYPRTPHLPFSEKLGRDDLILKDLSCFDNKRLVVSEKMDGENITVYRNGWHARSLDSKHKPYHSYLQNKILPILQPLIPEDYRICGEYLYARHTIPYDDLEDFYLVHSIWKGDKCLSWEETEHRCKEWGLKTVPVFYTLEDTEFKWSFIRGTCEACSGEGVVVRNADSFTYGEFAKNIAKFVREYESVPFNGRTCNSLANEV